MNGAQAAGEKLIECRALWQAGATLLEAGRWREAEPPLTQALSILEAHLGAGHLDIARACNSLAIVYYKVSMLIPVPPTVSHLENNRILC